MPKHLLTMIGSLLCATLLGAVAMTRAQEPGDPPDEAAAAAPLDRTLIHAGRLIDGRGDRAIAAATITVAGGQIVAVAGGYVDPAPGDRVVDLRDATVMPGLMDMHVHITSEQSGTAGYAERFYLNPTDMALRATLYLERTLMAGFTTVRDLGSGHKLNLAVRDAVAKGWVVGPRIIAAGSVTTTGGHGDGTSGLATELQEALAPRLPAVVDGTDGMRAAVRQRYKDGADLIKVASTGGVLSLTRSGHAPLFTEAELTAVVETARDYGLKVAAHAHGDEGMLRAVRAGVHSIEHGTYMSDAVMTEMKRRGTYYVPTISAGRFVAEKAREDGYFPEVVRPKAAEIGPLIQDTFARAYRAGVKIAFGTDQGVAPHGANGMEFVYMVEAGMPPMEAIRSATLEGARLIDREADLGTIEAGKLADIVAVRGDPLTDIRAMTEVVFVMKEGIIYRQ